MTHHWAALPSYNNAMLIVIIYESAFVERSLYLGGSSKTQPCLVPMAGSKCQPGTGVNLKTQGWREPALCVSSWQLGFAHSVYGRFIASFLEGIDLPQSQCM